MPACVPISVQLGMRQDEGMSSKGISIGGFRGSFPDLLLLVINEAL